MRKNILVIMGLVVLALFSFAGCNNFVADIGQPDQEYVQKTVKDRAFNYASGNFPFSKIKVGECRFTDYFVGKQTEGIDENGIKQQVKKVSVTCVMPFSMFIPGSMLGPSSTDKKEVIFNAVFLCWINEKGIKKIKLLEESTIKINSLN